MPGPRPLVMRSKKRTIIDVDEEQMDALLKRGEGAKGHREPGLMDTQEIPLPYLPLPYSRAVGLAKFLKPLAPMISKANPAIETDAEQAGLSFDLGQYSSVALLTGLIYFLSSVIVLETILMNPDVQFSLGDKADPLRVTFLFGSFVVGIVMTMQVMYYPKILSNQKAKEIEKDLLYALRHLTVQMRSGAILYQALRSVAQGGYGEVSKEFSITVKQISAGMPAANAVGNTAIRNKSPTFRKILWQLENGVRTGTDLGEMLLRMTQNHFEEQKIAIQKFGKEMNGLSMMFMIVTVIFPVMAVVTVALATFLPIPPIPSSYLYLFLVLIALAQFFFIGFVQEKRPPVYF